MGLSELGRVLPGRDIRLWEPGCSAGLNLRADHLPGLMALEIGPLPRIIERRGCDLDPVDVTTADGRTWLSSFVWVDDVDRFAALSSALQVASRVPVEIDRAEAAAWLSAAEPAAGSVLVIWHSALAMYLDADRRAAVASTIRGVAERATPRSPVAHLAWEWAEDGAPAEFALTCRWWSGRPDDGAPVVLARGGSHGRPVARVGVLTA
jgi:hypothetical protein